MRIRWPTKERQTIADDKLCIAKRFIDQELKKVSVIVDESSDPEVYIGSDDAYISELIAKINQLPYNQQLTKVKDFLQAYIDTLGDEMYFLIFYHCTLYHKEKVIEIFEGVYGSN